MSKMRELADVGQLFFIADDTKIKGNKAYDRGRYYDALEAYEQVLGCFLWLEPNRKVYKDRQEFEDKIFMTLRFKGLVDSDVEVREKQVVREIDREIEEETSKNEYLYLFRIGDACWQHYELCFGLHEHASS